MRRILLITLLLLSSGPAYAEWVKIAETDKPTEIIYLDPETIRRKGNFVKMWQLTDLKTVQTKGGVLYLSHKGQVEFGCLEERYRILAFSRFSGNMGHGNVVYSHSDEQKWEPVYPESVGQTAWNVACGKK
jgi:hypothetical protein